MLQKRGGLVSKWPVEKKEQAKEGRKVAVEGGGDPQRAPRQSSGHGLLANSAAGKKPKERKPGKKGCRRVGVQKVTSGGTSFAMRRKKKRPYS